MPGRVHDRPVERRIDDSPVLVHRAQLHARAVQPSEPGITAPEAERNQDVNEVAAAHFDTVPGDSSQPRDRDPAAGVEEGRRCALLVREDTMAILVDPRQDYLPWTVRTNPVPDGLVSHETRTRLLARDDAVLLAQNGA